MSPTAALAALPVELLSLIVQELELEDLLNSRVVCKSMYVASQSRQVWSSFIRKNLGTTIPPPFFLPKPIQECSQAELESSIRRLDADWDLKIPLQMNKIPIVKEEPTTDRLLGTSFCVIPGGQFVLAGLCDGSVRTVDLSGSLVSTSNVPASLLIPPPATLPVTARAVQVRLAMDYISEEALGESRESCYLSQFNLATIVCEDESSSSHVDVWRIHLSRPETDGTSGVHVIKVGEHLCSYMESPTDYLRGLSLYGNIIAYSMELESPPTNCIVIVDWHDADAKKEDDELLRWYIPDSPIKLQTIHLLPGDHIFVENNMPLETVAAVYNWRLRCPTSTLPPSRQNLNRIPHPWSQSLSSSDISGFAISHPVIMNDTIRLVVPTIEALYFLTIPMDDHDLEAVQFEEVLATTFSANQSAQSFGNRRAVGIDHTSDGIDIFTAQYRFKEDGIPKKGYRPTCQRHPYSSDPRESIPYLFFDQFSNRIIQIDEYASYVVTLPSHAFHSINPKGTTETDRTNLRSEVTAETASESGESGHVEGGAIAGYEQEVADR
ncbi:hypothetical protein DFP72DRAFT_584324 [Ephemerocybe angulata]|uniref:F-box domain-containing protein n=1 Tax=Ephemerocybe angulata TaxID=980116 RepID=A0A8H6HJA0_9AGAR|nr:hypothetical protein DFP72DRAFT_584324 [Tulosesus angulatus]